MNTALSRSKEQAIRSSNEVGTGRGGSDMFLYMFPCRVVDGGGYGKSWFVRVTLQMRGMPIRFANVTCFDFTTLFLMDGW